MANFEGWVRQIKEREVTWQPGDRVAIIVYGQFIDTGEVIEVGDATCLVHQDTVGSTKPFYHDQLRPPEEDQP